MAGIYIHIPFCKSACNYCNFHFSTSLKSKPEFLKALIKEMELRKHFFNGEPIETVYLGGGTPSLLTQDDLKLVFEKLDLYFSLSNLKECTLEANPDDLNPNYLQSLKSTLINRLSIGVQSFHEADLLFMKRAHTALQSQQAIKDAQDKGFTNLTIDLIYGTPGLSNSGWLQNIHQVKYFDIPHFSAYALTVEEKTALHFNIKNKKTAQIDSDVAATQFQILMKESKQLQYDHYEISNFAKKNHYAIHNTNYWKGLPYLGLGPSAHSYIDLTRSWNIANNALYIKSLLVENKCTTDQELLSPTQQLNEYIMTSLRTIWGINLDFIEQKWGVETAKKLIQEAKPIVNSGKIMQKENCLILTDEGKLFADAIAAQLFQ